MLHMPDQQLEVIKSDLEQRLARFQKAFQERHGRNPTEEEKAPAKPAMKKYIAVCQELAKRRKAAAAAKEAEATAAAASLPRNTVTYTEQVTGQAQIGETGAVVAAVREATRRKEAVRAGGDGAGSGMQQSTTATAGMAQFTGFMGGGGMIDLIFTWGQFVSIWGDVTVSVSENMHGFDVSLNAPWAVSLEQHVFKYMRLFAFDVQALHANFDISFLTMLGWKETHLAFTVIVPFLISLVTVFLLRSLGDILRLSLLTAS